MSKRTVGHRAADVLEHLEVLGAGVHRDGAAGTEQLGEGQRIDRQGVEEGDAVGPPELQHGDVGPEGALAVELGVEGELGLARELVEEDADARVGVDPAVVGRVQ